ncbi:MAG: serine/threonine protein kinase [Oscillatoriales cyanobacterium C42_A2020_001]|nr:serine/threonine protein kinase [Leptolyngbyaceae cyanobacterium C42_A2020_001]
MTTDDPNIGRLIANRYHLVELVGRGAMGRVYRAEDVLLGGVIAVKFLIHNLLTPRMRDRFKTEARTCAQLGQRSLHIVRVTDYGVDGDDVPFYVMEYLQGESLGEVITSQTLPLPRFLSLARQICLGLQCAHQGIQIENQLCPIIHRDIKPSNILVSHDTGFGELVKILDFGIAKLLQEDSGQTSSFMGTLPYSSPEQMEGQDLDPRSDIYSFGVMMFEMLTGRMPLQAETHSFGGWYRAHHFQTPRTFDAVNPALRLPRALETLVMACLEKKASDRPQSIAEVLKALVPLEERYSASRQIGNRIGEVLARRSLPEERQIQQLPVPLLEQIYQSATWPTNMPIAQIVFPHVFAATKESVATIWVMLPMQEIRSLQLNRLYNKIYKNFLCTLSPHPMVLWITALYNRFHSKETGPRWLRCYLDLKTPQGQSLIHLLADRQEFYIILFALENPRECAHVIKVQIHHPQCLGLKQWAIQAQTTPSVGQPSLSKTMLQSEFERLKQRIVEDLVRTDEHPSWDG